MNTVEYKQGMTTVWSDGEKIIIKNPSGRQHIKDNVEQIFGMGEYDKIYQVKYSDEETIGAVNSYATEIEIVSGYIPERVKEDLGIKSLPGISAREFFL